MKTYDRNDFQATRVHAMCCCKLCSTHYGQKVKQLGYKSPHEHKLVDKKPKSKYRSPITKEQQDKLNSEIDKKFFSLKLESKTYKPGTKEWNDVVTQITPIHLVKRSVPQAEGQTLYGVY